MFGVCNHCIHFVLIQGSHPNLTLQPDPAHRYSVDHPWSKVFCVFEVHGGICLLRLKNLLSRVFWTVWLLHVLVNLAASVIILRRYFFIRWHHIIFISKIIQPSSVSREMGQCDISASLNCRVWHLVVDPVYWSFITKLYCSFLFNYSVIREPFLI